MDDPKTDDKTLKDEISDLEVEVELEQPRFEKSQDVLKEENLNATIPHEEQENLNKPLEDPTGTSDEDQEFIKMVLALIDEGKIDLHVPDTLLNKDVYDQLTEEEQGYADINAVTLLNKLREIKNLYEAGYENTYQLNNMIHWVRVTKERIESEKGDIYII